jgi:probable phosphoglycerate mutase
MPPDEPVRQSRFRRPPGAADILLVRHGESAAFESGKPFALADGHGDPELHPAGRRQAEAVAERLADEPISAIYVTTLRRTAETAAPLAARLGIEPRVEPDLREVHLGEWEGGVLRAKVAEGDPIAARIQSEQRWDVIPGAEPAEEFAARVAAGLARIAAAHPDELVVVVAHGGVIGEALAQVSGSRRLAFAAADNGSISQIVLGPTAREVRRFNDTSHLAGALTSAATPPT